MNKNSKITQSKNYTKSKNYRKGSFQNLHPTPMKPSDVSYFHIIMGMLNRPKTVYPPHPLPSVKTDLKKIDPNVLQDLTAPRIIWFGHSSYLIQYRGKNILVDPVFNKYASPVPGMIKAFKGANVYAVNDMPEIDLLIITHNHYDHLDCVTIRKLKSNVKHCLTTLGVGKTLVGCGISRDIIIELDWWESKTYEPLFELTATPARHFSGRSIKRGDSLWASFVLKMNEYKVFIGGDSGYDDHFKLIGEQFGPFDIAILECGQYNTSWPLIHMMPEETIQATKDLNSKVLFPVHWGKFTLANHPWNEPPQKAMEIANRQGVKITQPMIGEPIIIGEHYPQKNWWDLVK